MVTAIVLVCYQALAWAACDEMTASDVISREASPIECATGGINAQEELAKDPRGYEGYFVKLICSKKVAGNER